MNTATASPDASHGHDSGQIHAHPLPLTVLFGVYGVLIVFTVLTVAVAYVELGKLNIWVAMIIAVLKASFVVLYFMHLRYDSPFNAIVFVGCLIFVSLFLFLMLVRDQDVRTACQAEARRWDVVMSDYTSATLPNPYGLRYVAWQFTATARVAGFAGPVDLNRTIAAADSTSSSGTGSAANSKSSRPRSEIRPSSCSPTFLV